MIMNIRFIFASDQNNVVDVKKKSNDNDAFKFRQIAILKRITLDIRIRIDKFAVRSRFILKRFRNISKVRRRIFFSSEHFEAQIEKQDDEFFDDFIDDDDDDAMLDNDRSSIRQSRAKRSQNLETYQTHLRRQLNIKKMKKKLKFTLFTQRTLFSFTHSSKLHLLVVFSVHDLTNLYFESSNLWLSSKFVIEIRTIFKHNTNSKYFKIENKFVNVSLRLLKDVYNCTLKFKNLFKFIFSFATFDVFVDSRLKSCKNVVFLLLILKMYCNVMFDFVYSNIRHELNYIINQYRVRITKTHVYKTWSSILIWHEKNLIRIIRIDQNVSINWLFKHDVIEWTFKNIFVVESNKKTIDSQLFFISRATIKSKKSNKFVTIRNENCYEFNHNVFCKIDFCEYKHICIKCQRFDHDKFECFEIKIFKWLIDTFSFNFSSFVSMFSLLSFFISYFRHMMMSTSIEWFIENFLYDVAFENAFKFEIKMSLKIEKWKLYSLKHFDQNFVSKLFDIIKRNANVEYIEIKKIFDFKNYRSINEIFDILIVDFQKQFVVNQKIKIQSFFLSLHLFVLKFDFQIKRRMKTYSRFIVFKRRFNQRWHHIWCRNFKIRFVRWNHCNIHISRTRCCNVQRQFRNYIQIYFYDHFESLIVRFFLKEYVLHKIISIFRFTYCFFSFWFIC